LTVGDGLQATSSGGGPFNFFKVNNALNNPQDGFQHVGRIAVARALLATPTDHTPQIAIGKFLSRLCIEPFSAGENFRCSRVLVTTPACSQVGCAYYMLVAIDDKLERRTPYDGFASVQAT
jgi:hypothetical protein